MKQFRNNVIRAGLGALYFTGAHYLLRPIFSGVGAIFMLHHVRPRRDAEFQPNRHLEVAPEFLRAMLAHLRSRDIDIITMDEVHQRLIERNFSRRFACFTLDDGYRDNRDFALPVMREFDAPFTVYVASDFARGHRQAVVDRAGDGDRQGLLDRGRDRRRCDPPRHLDAGRQAGRVRPPARLAARRCRASTISSAKSARCARVTASTKPRSAASSACPGTS